MKLNPSSGAIPILTVGMFLFFPATGQEERFPMEYDVPVIREAKNDSSSSEMEIKPLNKSVINSAGTREHETIPKTTKTPAKSVEKSSKSESPKSEDPLSFNFLYYIIEKFKMSDMIE